MDVVNYTEFLVKSIASNPDMVKVSMFDGEDEEKVLQIIVHSDDMGAVIGKQGKTASAIRTLVQAYAYVNKLPKLKINIDSF